MRKVILSITALKAMNYLLETVLTPKHAVVLVHNGLDGMTVLRSRTQVDVIIVDLDYNTAENLDFIYHVKNSRLYSHCTVITLSSLTKLEISDNEMNMIDRVFEKPFSPQALTAFLDNLSNPSAVTMQN